jgi:hypothetical protein
MTKRTQRCLNCPVLAYFLALAAFLQSLSPTIAVQAGAADAPPPADQIEFFEKQVRPLLIKRCYACHAGTKARGGLLLDTARGWRRGGDSGPVVVPGRPDASLLIDAVNYRSLEMPPADAGGQLSVSEIDVLTRWVQMGAPDPRVGTDSIGGMSLDAAKSWWAFQPLPDITGVATPEQIDHQLDEALQREELNATGPADRRTLIRRGSIAGRFCTSDRPTARFTSVRRPMGPALARRRSLCGHGRREHRPTAASRLALSQLGLRLV